MSFIKCQVILPSRTALPANVVVNDWYFSTPSTVPQPAEVDLIGTHLATFYNVAPSGESSSVSTHLSVALSRTALTKIEYTDVTAHLSGSGAGSPFRTDTFTLGASEDATVSLPSEVAYCLTYQSSYGAAPEFGPGDTRPRSSHRGRVYLGPLTTNSIVGDANGVCHPNATLTNVVSKAATRLRASSTVDATWCQWSRTQSTMLPVAGGWVDNAFDTQRRRGEAPTGRTVWA